MTDIKLGGVPITHVNDTTTAKRMTMLLWGSSGCGKTTLAATAPGKKLLINFDPDGPASIANRDDVVVADLSASRVSIVDQFKGDNPLRLQQVFDDDPDIETVIVDSLTNVAQMCLMHGVSTVKGASIERPSPGAYQVRNALTLQLTKNMLRLTGKLGKHCIFIAHEASPVTNDDGMVLFITIALGGQLPNQATVDFSEIWSLSETDSGKHRIAIRPVRQRKPMKTRMMSTTSSQEFDWLYNPETLTGGTINDWYTAWKEGGYKKIPIPKATK
jgi:hypothetical protein